MLLNTQIKQNKKQGVTLVEVLIVLAIAAVVIAGALVLYGNLQRNSAVNEETTNLSAMFQNIDNFFRRGTTATLVNDDAISAGFIPGGMFVDEATGAIENAFGGQVAIVGTDDPADPKSFAIQYTRVPAEACVNFVQGQARVGWDYVTVADGSAVAPTVTAPAAAADGTTTALFKSTDGALATTARGSSALQELAIIELCDTNSASGYSLVTLSKSSSSS